jgi:hypothetical protein
MNTLRKLIKESIQIHNLKKKSCSCGCNTCEDKRMIAPILNESIAPREILSEGLKYHIDNNKPLTEHVYRAGSQKYFDLWSEARALYSRDIIDIKNQDDLEILTETQLGEFGMYEGKKVPLDFIMEEVELEEADKKKKTPPIGKPKRGGSKKFYVYVRDPKTKRVKKVSFGAPGMSVGFKNPKRRKAFAARHKCGTGEPRTSARYWSCRVGRYAKQLGLGNNFSGFW